MGLRNDLCGIGTSVESLIHIGRIEYVYISQDKGEWGKVCPSDSLYPVLTMTHPFSLVTIYVYTGTSCNNTRSMGKVIRILL